MRQPGLLLFAAISGFLAVALGAFGAHVLKQSLSAALLQAFQTGAEYQFYHSLALLFVTLAPSHLGEKYLARAGIAFSLGIVIFSGSLYLLALTGIRALGAVTPIGGIAFLCGWGLLAVAAYQAYRR